MMATHVWVEEVLTSSCWLIAKKHNTLQQNLFYTGTNIGVDLFEALGNNLHFYPNFDLF